MKNLQDERETMNEIELVQQDLSQKLTPTGKWRTILERSMMINNDETIHYTDAEATEYNGYNGPFERNVIMLSRPVFKEENLNTQTTNPLDEKPSELTKLLDAAYKISQAWKFWERHGHDLPHFIIEHIAYSYYDCMSGGMPYGEIQIARRLIQKLNIDLNKTIYPGKKNGGWYTVGDFMNDTKE